MISQVIAVRGVDRTTKCPLIMDWISLQVVLHNASAPNATLERNGNVCLCGLCGQFNTTHKAGFWKHSPHAVFCRVSSNSAFWLKDEHLFNATPECVCWDALHCMTRVEDNLVKYFFQQAPNKSAFTSVMSEIIRGWTNETSLTINTVRPKTVPFHFKLTSKHINFTDETVHQC